MAGYLGLWLTGGGGRRLGLLRLLRGLLGAEVYAARLGRRVALGLGLGIKFSPVGLERGHQRLLRFRRLVLGHGPGARLLPVPARTYA